MKRGATIRGSTTNIILKRMRTTLVTIRCGLDAVNGWVYTEAMAGLLDKAQRDRGKEGEPPPVPSAADISPEEGIELFAEIEQVIAKARTPITPELLAYTPRRSGLLFPLSLNIAALVVILLAVLFFSLFFNRQEQTITGGSGTMLTGESTLVSAMRREAEEKLRSKDQEIGQIQGALDQTTKRLDALRADAASQVQKKEQELRASFDQQLAAEKARLQNLGASAASIDGQLAVLRDQLQKSYDGKLAAFRQQVGADMAQKEAALTALLSGSQVTLTQAQAEKARLQAQLEAATRTVASAQGEEARLAQQMAALGAQGQREQLVLDQISASYAAVGAAMKASRFDDALGSLASLAAYLDQAGIASLPAVQRRKPVDIFLIDALEKLVASQKAAAPPAAAGAQSAASAPPAVSPRQTQALADAIAAGDALFAAGSFAPALEKYSAGLALLSDVPGIERLTARIAEAGYRQGLADLSARQDKAARPTLEKADALARRAGYAEAIAAYAAVVRTWPDSSYVNRSLTGIDGALSALLKKKDDDAARKDLARKTTAGDRLAVVTAGLASTARAADVAVAAAQKELIALLDAKVKVKAILGTDSVKAQYPGLAEALDRYLQLYGEEKTATGRAVALQDVGTVLDFLLGSKSRDALTPLGSRYGDQADRTAFQQILDRLRSLAP
jgi:hypothetical protein